jgi:outer membrane protein TolC
MVSIVTVFFIFMLCLPVLGVKAEDGYNEGAVREYSLDDLISSCFERNIDLKRAGEKVSAQLARVGKAKAKSLPGVSFTGVYTHIGVVSRFEMPGFGEIKFVNPEMLNFGLSIDYTLFDWGMTKDGAAIEKLGLKSQRLSNILMKKAFILQMSLLYYNILQVEENEVVFTENIAILKEILVLLKQQFDAGIIPEHQLLQTRVALLSLHAQQLELKKVKAEMIITLKNISGLPFDRGIRLKKMKGKKDFIPGDITPLLSKAAAEREDFKILNLQLLILEKSKTIISKSKLPLLAAGLQAELRNSIMPDVEKLRTNWNAGLTVIYNIFDRNNAKFEKETLTHELQALRLDINKLKRDVQANLAKLSANLKMLDDKITIEQERFEIAQKSLVLARESFKESQATYLEVLNARSNYNLAESSLIFLKYRKYINLLQVEFELYPLEYFLTQEET